MGWSALAIPDLPPAARTEAYRYKNSPTDDAMSLLSSPAYHRLPIAQRIRIEQEIDLLNRGEEASRPEDVSRTFAEAGLPTETLVEALGPLEPWDDYLVACNYAVLDAFYHNRAIDAGYDVAPTSLLYGEIFLQNLALINTFITDAALDLVSYTPSLPLALKKYSNIVEDVSARDGFIIVTYKPDSLPDISTPQSRTIFFPHYEQAGHAVAVSQPRKILNDVRSWLMDRSCFNL